MRQYPTVADTPNRKQRKSMRKNIFYENKYSRRAKKAEARRARRAGEKA